MFFLCGHCILCAVSLVLEFLWLIIDGKHPYQLEPIGYYLPLSREKPLAELSINMAPKCTGPAKLRTTSKGYCIFGVKFRTCSIMILTALVFWLVSFLKDCLLFTCNDLSQYALSKSARMMLGPAPVLKTLYKRSTLPAVKQKEIDTF